MKNTNKPYPLYELEKVSSFQDMIDQQVHLYPNKTAFSWQPRGKERIEKSRTEFAQDIHGLVQWMLAHHLSGTHIGIVADNSYEWILVFLSAAIAGAVAVPVNKDLDPKEIAELLTFADCDLVFYASGYHEFIEFLEPEKCIAIDKVSDYIISGLENQLEQPEIDPDSLAAIFFTSGTTGESKGVMLSHKNIISDINAACQNFVLEGDTIALLPFHHCFGLVTAVFMVFNYGGGTFIASSLKRVLKNIQEVKPQTIFLVPLFVETFHRKIWEMICKEKKEDRVRQLMKYSDAVLKAGIDVRKHLFSSITDTFGGNLEYIICGGALLDEAYIKDFHSWGIQILNGYGITECSPVVSVNRNHFIKKGSVGQIVPGMQAWESIEHEIWLKGDMVMQGYYKNPDATMAVLHNGWLNTQDLGYIDSDNFLFLTGRSKNLIILSNGENVSPEQIEMTLTHDKGIMEVVVYPKNGKIFAQVYPTEEYMGNQQYFDTLVKNYNRSQPAARQISKVELRDREFEKSATQKILRYKVTGEENE